MRERGGSDSETFPNNEGKSPGFALRGLRSSNLRLTRRGALRSRQRMTGADYRRLIARYITGAYGQRGVEVYEEVNVGTSIIGKQRRIDLLMLVGKQALGIECKYQDSLGTVDEKIPYALQDLAAQRFPGAIAYAGTGFSDG